MNKTLIPSDVIVDFDSREWISVYRGIKIYQNLSDKIQLVRVSFRQFGPSVRLAEMPASSGTGKEYYLEIYPNDYFARIYKNVEAEILIQRFHKIKDWKHIHEQINEYFDEREKSIKLYSMNIYLDYLDEQGARGRIPIGNSFFDLWTFLSKDNLTAYEREQGEISIDRKYESDIGQLGFQQKYLIREIQQMQKSVFVDSITGFFDQSVKTHYLKSITEEL